MRRPPALKGAERAGTDCNPSGKWRPAAGRGAERVRTRRAAGTSGQAKLQQAEQRVQILLSDNEDASLTPFTPDNE